MGIDDIDNKKINSHPKVGVVKPLVLEDRPISYPIILHAYLNFGIISPHMPLPLSEGDRRLVADSIDTTRRMRAVAVTEDRDGHNLIEIWSSPQQHALRDAAVLTAATAKLVVSHVVSDISTADQREQLDDTLRIFRSKYAGHSPYAKFNHTELNSL